MKPMRFQIPFVFHARAIPPGKRKQTAMSFVDVITVAIPVATDDIAPIIAEWVHPDRHWDGNSRHKVRMFGGTLYSARTAWDDEICDFVPIPRSGINGLEALGDTGLSKADKEVLEAYTAGKEPPRLEDCRDVEDCDRDDVEAIVREKFSRMLIAEGVLWEPCAAPVVVLDFAGSRGDAIRVEAVTFTHMGKCADFIGRLQRAWHEKPIILDRSRPELLESVRNTVLPTDSPYLPVFEVDSIPMDLCAREFDRGVLAFARRSLEALPAPLQDYDDASIRRWMALRQASDELDRAIADDRDTDYCLQAVFDALGATVDMTGGKSAVRLGLLVDIWEARDIGHSLANIGSAPSPAGL